MKVNRFIIYAGIFVLTTNVVFSENISNQNQIQKKQQKYESSNPPIIIDNFDIGETQGVIKTTTIGGRQGTFSNRPAWCIITKNEEIRRSNKGKSLKIEWHNGTGWCGWYTLLGGIDVSKYNALTFWIKGTNGGEKFEIGMADQKMQDMGIDAKYVGAVNFFMDKEVTKEWQKAKIPLSRLEAEIDLSSLGSLVFWFRYENPQDVASIYIDDVMVENDPDIEKMEEYNAPRAEFDPKHPRSMWVWKWDPVNNEKIKEQMFELCLNTAIRTCYIYFGDFSEDDDPEYTKRLENFLSESHSKGIKVEILTGNPVWCLKENHHLAYNWMKSFLEYNKKRNQELRVDGCSFDVEPYLAGEWQTRREEVKKEYLDLLRKLRELVDSYEGMHFEIGGAIPTFYKEEGDFEENMLKYLDYAALMAYYDTPGKIIDNSKYHIELAQKMGKRMYIGAETQDLVAMCQGKRANTFYEEGWEEMEQVLKVVEDYFRGSKGYAGIAMHCDYSYKLLQRGRNTPLKKRLEPDKLPQFVSRYCESTVTIDGKIEEWIKDNPLVLKEKDQVVYGRGAWQGEDDYSVKAYSMWDQYNIYFAFEVKDNTHVQMKSKQDMWEGDHIELWFDADLESDYMEAMNSNDDFQFGFNPGNFADIKPEVYIFIPELSEEFYLENAEIAVAKKNNGYIMEVRIDAKLFKNVFAKNISPNYSQEKSQMYANREMITNGPDSIKSADNQPFIFKVGQMFGYSVDGADCDDKKAPQKLIMSSSKERVWGDPTTFNVIKLKE